MAKAAVLSAPPVRRPEWKKYLIDFIGRVGVKSVRP